MNDFPTYREDELSKRETGHIVKRYIRVLKQNLTPIPDDIPFKDTQKLIESDPTVDPFDTLEMLGPVGIEPRGRRPAAPGRPECPGSRRRPREVTPPARKELRRCTASTADEQRCDGGCAQPRVRSSVGSACDRR